MYFKFDIIVNNQMLKIGTKINWIKCRSRIFLNYTIKYSLKSMPSLFKAAMLKNYNGVYYGSFNAAEGNNSTITNNLVGNQTSIMFCSNTMFQSMTEIFGSVMDWNIEFEQNVIEVWLPTKLLVMVELLPSAALNEP